VFTDHGHLKGLRECPLCIHLDQRAILSGFRTSLVREFRRGQSRSESESKEAASTKPLCSAHHRSSTRLTWIESYRDGAGAHPYLGPNQSAQKRWLIEHIIRRALSSQSIKCIWRAQPRAYNNGVLVVNANMVGSLMQSEWRARIIIIAAACTISLWIHPQPIYIRRKLCRRSKVWKKRRKSLSLAGGSPWVCPVIPFCKVSDVIGPCTHLCYRHRRLYQINFTRGLCMQVKWNSDLSGSCQFIHVRRRARR